MVDFTQPEQLKPKVGVGWHVVGVLIIVGLLEMLHLAFTHWHELWPWVVVILLTAIVPLLLLWIVVRIIRLAWTGR